MTHKIFFPMVRKSYTESLADVLAGMGKTLGCAVSANGLDDYGEFVAANFHEVTPEVEGKFGYIRTNEYTWRMAGINKIHDFALEKDIDVHGHTMLWNLSTPQWIIDSKPDARKFYLTQFIREMLTDYRYFHAWDIANECYDEAGKLRDGWWNCTGGDYVCYALDVARNMCSPAQFYYNDFIMTPAWMHTVEQLAADGLIDGVGVQMHLDEAGFDFPTMIEFANRLEKHSCRLRITEADVRIPMPKSIEGEKSQITLWRELARLVKHPNCTGITFWGAHDGASWIPAQYPGYGSALLWDAEMQPKPAYYEFCEELNK